MDQSNITQTILNTINYIFETLLSSIDNRLYGILDDLTFVNSDILHDNYFSKIFGRPASLCPRPHAGDIPCRLHS